MSRHAPKTAALLAYAEGALSPAGQRRLERHLGRCPVCEEHLRAIRAYHRTLAEARALPPRLEDPDRIEEVLAEEAERISGVLRARRQQRGWWIAGTGALGLAAAAALVGLWLPASTPPAAPVAAPSVPAPVPDEPPPDRGAPRDGTVSWVLADGTWERPNGSRAALVAGQRVTEGGTLRVPEGSGCHVRLGPGTGLVLEGGTSLTFRRLRDAEVVLDLTAGRTVQRVAPLPPGGRFVVLADRVEVEVRGTHFAVDRRELQVQVQVQEGEVEIRGPDGPRAVRAPGRWPPSAEPVAELPGPWGLGEVELAPLTLADPDIVRWAIDEGPEVEGRLSLLLAPGPHRVRGWNAKGRRFGSVVEIGESPLRIGRADLEPEVVRPPRGELDPTDIARVVRAARRNLQRCYERALRNRPTLEPTMRLKVRVGALGDVTRVEILDAPEASQALRSCVEGHARRWTFPSPGGFVDFEVPLTFSRSP
ncbi:MAG: AgmX/PglI C-terminal domain-containing protein [Sandaracinaceae bacterium]